MSQTDTKQGRTHNADGAREAILNAAEKIFAEHGFDGARVDAIAAESGYNKSLIFQYFGDKLNLYAGVIRRADEQMRGLQNQVLAELLQREAVSDIKRLKSVLRSFMSAYFDYLTEHPNYVRILNWEMAEGWQTYMQISVEDDREDLVNFSAPMQLIGDSGWLRSRVNVMVQMILALFIGQMYLGLVPLFKMYLPDVDSQSKETMAQAREFIVGFIAHGLIADSDESKG